MRNVGYIWRLTVALEKCYYFYISWHLSNNNILRRKLKINNRICILFEAINIRQTLMYHRFLLQTFKWIIDKRITVQVKTTLSLKERKCCFTVSVVLPLKCSLFSFEYLIPMANVAYQFMNTCNMFSSWNRKLNPNKFSVKLDRQGGRGLNLKPYSGHHMLFHIVDVY